MARRTRRRRSRAWHSNSWSWKRTSCNGSRGRWSGWIGTKTKQKFGKQKAEIMKTQKQSRNLWVVISIFYFLLSVFTSRAYPPAPASQAQVNAGVEPYLYVTPKTLARATGLISQGLVFGSLTLTNTISQTSVTLTITNNVVSLPSNADWVGGRFIGANNTLGDFIGSAAGLYGVLATALTGTVPSTNLPPILGKLANNSVRFNLLPVLTTT